jgi:RND family efflux transporter MFP subunit
MSSSNSIEQPTKRKRVLIPIGIILSGVVVLVLMTMSAPKPQKKEILQKATLVDVIEVTKGSVVFEIESQGSIAPRTETTLISEVSGQIKQVSNKFVVGGFFNKGEVLLTIDPISYEVALLQAQARLDGANAKLVEEKARGKQAEKEWKLTGRAFKNAPILALRKPQLQQALADVKAAEADVKNAEIKLARTEIKAPYDAMVKAKNVDIGQYVSTGSQLATTFAVDYAEIRLPIKEQDIAYLDIPALGVSDDQKQKGSQVTLSSFQGGKIKTWSTFITRSEGVVDATSRVNYVVAQLDDPYGLMSQTSQMNPSAAEPIRMGTFVKAKIFGIESDNIISIPRKAIRGENNIYLLDDNKKLNITQVDILRSDANNIYISSGVDDGEKVIVTKLATAVNGMKLRLPGDKETQQIEGSTSKIEEADGSGDDGSIMAGKASPESDVNKANSDEPSIKDESIKNGGNL